MGSSLLFYRLALGAARFASPVIGGRDTKLTRGLQGRVDAHGVLSRWGRAERDPSRPCVWLHAPSVGETFQARAVAAELMTRQPDLQLVFTHFSPSAEAVAGRVGADVHGYLPWDLAGPIRETLDAVRPDAVLFTKTEVWPVLASEARARGACTGLIAATVPPDAGRMTWPARLLLGQTWAALDRACAIATPDGDRLRSLGVPAEKVIVTGDPGVDSAIRRADSAPRQARHLAPFQNESRPVIVAGSTWPTDEAVLLPALFEVKKRVPDLRVILAPHEPDTAGTRDLTSRFEAAGWSARTLSVVESTGALDGTDAILVDRVGVLAHLYHVGRVAYVGGGFHDAGLHSVLEPAAARVPIVFGPRHVNAKAASDLLSASGAVEIRDSEGLAGALEKWLLDDAAHDYAASRAFGYIDAHRGAAERTADAVIDLLPSHSV